SYPAAGDAATAARHSRTRRPLIDDIITSLSGAPLKWCDSMRPPYGTSMPQGGVRPQHQNRKSSERANVFRFAPESRHPLCVLMNTSPKFDYSDTLLVRVSHLSHVMNLSPSRL